MSLDAVVVADLVKDYGRGRTRHRALKGITLRIGRGTAFGLVGPNGAGKTTLLKSLLGVTRATSGSVQVLGGSPADPRVRRRIGYLPERLALPEAWTANAFLHSVARLKGIADAERDVLTQLQRVGLPASGSVRIGAFSKGMRQRLGLAAALIGTPDLLILDEPTDGIDPKGRVEVRELLEQERERGATIFLNSHLLAETERVCDQVGFLVGGELRQSGAMADLCVDRTAWCTHFQAGVEVESLTSLGFMPAATPDRFTWRGDVEALNQALSRARDAGALLVALEPQGHDLEAKFMAMVDDT